MPLESISIRPALAGDTREILALLAENGWSHRIGNETEFTELLAASQLKFVAVTNGGIIGFTRALTDGQSNGYISMVAVQREFRGQGIGSELVERILESAPEITWVLRAGREGSKEFFFKLGFSQSQIAMERTRPKRDA